MNSIQSSPPHPVVKCMGGTDEINVNDAFQVRIYSYFYNACLCLSVNIFYFRLGVVWFALASVVVIWDALFVLLRPRSMPGGDLQQFWKPC